MIPPQPLMNFEIQKYYWNEPRFNGLYSRDNLPKRMKDGAYVIYFDEYADVGIHGIALYVFIEIIYFDSFGGKHFPKEIEKFIGDRSIKANIHRIQASNSMCGLFCIGFIDFMFVFHLFYIQFDVCAFMFVFTLWFWKKWYNS